MSYIVWALLHFQAAFAQAELGERLPPGMVHGRILQNAWHLAFFASVALIVALALNWRNSRLGFWLNAAAVSATDIGFVAFILVPGYAPIWPGIAGPLLWLLGLAFTAAALGKRAGRS